MFVFASGMGRAEDLRLVGMPPLSVIIDTGNERRAGDGVLPGAQLYGPDGASDIPTIDRRAHRSYGRSTVRFSRPVYHGQRLDWCAAPGQECGGSTAQHFCEQAGFSRVIEAVQERDVGLYASTMQIASGLACIGRGCHGFLRITCTRS